MSNQLIPANPSEVMVIRNVTPNIVTLSVPFSRFGHFKVGGRGTIVRLTSGALAVFSPVALTPEVSSVLQSMGNNLKYIVAPDIEHHIFVSDWYNAYSNAHVIGPEGLPEKRQQSSDPKHGKVPFTTVFTAKDKATIKISEEFDQDFEYEYVDGHLNKELVFYYKPDKTLIEADYLFNLPATEQYSKSGVAATSGLLSKLFNSLQSTQGKALAQQRVLWYGQSSGDRPGFAKSTSRIDTWDFERIIPCHGDVIEKDGKGIFRKIMAWHLENKKST